jgi:hypothetical protein
MPAVSRTKRIDALMEEASQALATTSYFKAERQALKALELARKAEDFDRMARILLPLQEARRQRTQTAFAVGTVTIVEEPWGERRKFEPGCYLFRPPVVGADARAFRLAAHAAEAPVAVICREPLTQMGLCPIVAISPGGTVRCKIRPPKAPDNPDLAWFADAMEQLGEHAIDMLDPEMPTLKRLDTLLARLDAVPEHEELHQALAETCRVAAREMAEADAAQEGRPKKKPPARSKAG